MIWHGLLKNQETLTRLYSDVPSLHDVRLRSVNLNWRGPGVTLRIDLPRYPDLPPAEWEEGGADTLQCHIKFLAVDHLALHAWNPPTSASITLTPSDRSRVQVGVHGPGVHLEFSSSDSLRVDHVSAFTAAPDGMDTGPHQFLRKLDARLHTSPPRTHERNFYANL